MTYYLLVALAIVVFLGVPCLIAVAHDKLHELQRVHQIEEHLIAEGKRHRADEQFERMIHPAAGNGLVEVDEQSRRWTR